MSNQSNFSWDSHTVSPMGIIPKKNKPNKWRLIVDLSSPKGFNINEDIPSELSPLSYASLNHLSALVLSAVSLEDVEFMIFTTALLSTLN